MQADTLQQIIFFAFAGLTVFAALMVVTQNNPVRSVLSLVLAFVASAVLWILLQAEFLALILVLVYVGAVMTLFLFVIMMLNIDVESIKTHLLRYAPIGLLLVALMVGLLLVSLPTGIFSGTAQLAKASSQLTNTEALGMVLYTDYVFAFELAAIILLVAIIAAITLVHRAPRKIKTQDIVKQIMTRKEDRLTLTDCGRSTKRKSK